jgi:hypothetical protein
MPRPSSVTFWDLMDRWDVSDDQAMELVGYEGKLPTTNRRPRFRLSTEQARIVATLLEVASALATAGLDPVAAQTLRNGIAVSVGPDACRGDG